VVKSTRLSLKWKRPKVVFIDSISDLFREQIPESFIWLNRPVTQRLEAARLSASVA
jgi:protein gp37